MSYPKWVGRGYGIGEVLCLNEAEEEALHADTAARNAPPEDEEEDDGETIDTVRAKLDELGIEYKRTLGLKKLKALLPAE